MSGRDGWTVILAVAEFFRPRRAPEEKEEAPPPFVQYQDRTYIPQAPGKGSRSFTPGFIVAVIGIVIMLSGLFLPWYSSTISGKAWIGNVYYDVYDRSDYSFSGIRFIEEKSVPGFTIAKTSSSSWGEYEKQYRDTRHVPSQLSPVYSGAMLAMVASVTMCALGAFLAAIFRLRKKAPLFPALVLLIGALLAMGAAGAFCFGHPPAVKNEGAMMHQPTYPTDAPSGPGDSFFGRSGRAPLDYEWGPAAGWYLSLSGPVLIIIGAVVLYALNRGRNG